MKLKVLLLKNIKMLLQHQVSSQEDTKTYFLEEIKTPALSTTDQIKTKI